MDSGFSNDSKALSFSDRMQWHRDRPAHGQVDRRSDAQTDRHRQTDMQAGIQAVM